MIKHCDKIFIAGHLGLLGSELKKTFNQHPLILKTKQELDLRDSQAVAQFFKNEKPTVVLLAAAHVGGIKANNTYPADFIYDNTLIQTNVIHHAAQNDVKKLIFYGSSCIYPCNLKKPIDESQLYHGPLERTNDAYALAKLNGIKMCQAYNKQYQTQYITLIPCNLYGPHDHFDLESSHVIPALIQKIFHAKQKGEDVTLWGHGTAKREFLYAQDLAKATQFILNLDESKTLNLIQGKTQGVLNIGTGRDITIAELATLIAEIIQFKGKIKWDHTQPDGTHQKTLNIEQILKLGWVSQTPLKKGLQVVIKNYNDSMSRSLNPKR